MTTLTGDVTGSGTDTIATTVQPNVVTNAKLAQMPAATLKGNNTGAAANAQDLTAGQVKAMIDQVNGPTDVQIVNWIGDTTTVPAKFIRLVPSAAGENYLGALGQAAPGRDVYITASAPICVLFNWSQGSFGNALIGLQDWSPSIGSADGGFTLDPGDYLHFVATQDVTAQGYRIWQCVGMKDKFVEHIQQPGGDRQADPPQKLWLCGKPQFDLPTYFSNIDYGPWPVMLDPYQNSGTGKVHAGEIDLKCVGDGVRVIGSPMRASSSSASVPALNTVSANEGGFDFHVALRPFVVNPFDGKFDYVSNTWDLTSHGGPNYNNYGPSYLYQGESTRITHAQTEDPSPTGTGGAFVIKVTKNGTVTPIQRGWWTHNGGFFAAGKSTFEGGHVPYPYNLSGNEASRGATWDAPSGDCNYYETPAWANLNLVMTDINDAQCENFAGVAMRKYGAHGEGMDIGYDASAGTINTYAVHNSGRTAVEKLDPTKNVISYPTKPAFQAGLSADAANVTGAGSFYTVAFNSVVFDLNSNFSNGVFTAPVSGAYQLQAMVQLSGLTSAMNWFRISINTSKRTYVTDQGVKPDGQGRALLQLQTLADMAAGDTASVQIYVAGGAQQVSVMSGGQYPMTRFSGFLVA